MNYRNSRPLSIGVGVIVILSMLLGGSGLPATGPLSVKNSKSGLGVRVANAAPTGDKIIFLPTVSSDGTSIPVGSGGDWPQLGHDAQRTNATYDQVNPPYCYAWKWYGVPFASRVQPVVFEGRLFIGGMDGVLYARNATTGEDLWTFQTGGPIRHTAGVGGQVVVVSSHDGKTYGLDTRSGGQLWQAATGPSGTAPLIDTANNRVFVGSTNGRLTALNLSNGSEIWRYDAGAAILTSPSLSVDRNIVYFGSEAMKAIAVAASSGQRLWQTSLPGQSLAERYPVVTNSAVIYRSQPLFFFHTMLKNYGDEVMDQAGSRAADWAADWNNVRPKITSFLSGNPNTQTFFALNSGTGASLGTAPVLYTYGNNDIPAPPVIQNGQIFTSYRARHGIQTDSGTVHVATKYDAELGKMTLPGLDIQGLRSSRALSGQPEFRMTSDEPSMISMGGEILWVDNWERLGGVNVRTGELIHAANVSNTWPECFGAECGTGGGPRPFFPMSGSGSAYPFPAPRASEGRSRGGVVIANSMLYWRVIEGGIGAIAHDADGRCSSIPVHSQPLQDPLANWQAQSYNPAARGLADYVSLDLTIPPGNPDPELVDRIRREVRSMLTAAAGDHLMPLYLERGDSSPVVWPYNNTQGESTPPRIHYQDHGNILWHDPGELLYSMAAAYPYLDSQLKADLKAYMAAEIQRYSPLQDLPYETASRDWLRNGKPREAYPVPFRSQLGYWPPPAVNISALYGLWLWSKNTGDWSYATAQWSQIETLFNAKGGSSQIRFYADIAGVIGYARLAKQIKGEGSAQYQAGVAASISAMQAGLNFAAFRDRANSDYKDPRNIPTGWAAPVFFGIVPEVGLYLREQLGGQAQNYLASLEGYNSGGEGLVWWYLTKVGAHAQDGETSYELPFAAWSHYLGHAYILGEPRSALKVYLDRPIALGDLYSIQKLAAALQAQ